eukprot:1809073-Rhodomonas_salina.1
MSCKQSCCFCAMCADRARVASRLLRLTAGQGVPLVASPPERLRESTCEKPLSSAAPRLCGCWMSSARYACSTAHAAQERDETCAALTGDHDVFAWADTGES